MAQASASTASSTRTSRAATAALSLVTVPEREKVVQLFLQGYLPREIGQTIRKTEKVIKAVLRACGYEPQRYSFSEDQMDLWARMYEGKEDDHYWSVAAIAKKFGKSPGTILKGLLLKHTRIRHRTLTMRLLREEKRKKRN